MGTKLHDLDTGDAYEDIVDHDTYVRGVPHSTFARLRRDDPVSWRHEHDGGKGFWAVTRYRDLLAVSRDPETFTCTRGIRLEEMAPDELVARRTMLEMDPPEHTKLRRLVQRGFTKRVVDSYENVFRQLTALQLDTVLAKGRFDFVTDIARELPIRLLSGLLGVPEEDSSDLVEWADGMISNADPEFTDHVVDQVDTDEFRLLPFRSPSALKVFRYAEEARRQRLAHPTDDLITTLLSPMADGEPLTDLEFKNFFGLLIVAGNDTTRHTISHGLLALLEHRDQLHAWQSNPALGATAADEILRWSSVTMHFRRTATRDVDLGGRAIKAGDKVVMWFGSANVDGDKFDDPFRFDVSRTPNEHVAFGLSSPHICLGAWLARLEVRVTFEELLRRVSDVRIAGPVERLRSNFISGIKHLPVDVVRR